MSNVTRRENERRLAAELEAHDNVDIALSEELFKGGCPLCRHRVVQGRRFLRSLVYEGINDIGFRKVLERSRGFCERHTVELYEADRDEMGGALGAAILLESVLRMRADGVEAMIGRDPRVVPGVAARSSWRTWPSRRSCWWMRDGLARIPLWSVREG
jgi:hypothetical protein